MLTHGSPLSQLRGRRSLLSWCNRSFLRLMCGVSLLCSWMTARGGWAGSELVKDPCFGMSTLLPSSQLIREYSVALDDNGYPIGAAVMHFHLRTNSPFVPRFLSLLPLLQPCVSVSCRRAHRTDFIIASISKKPTTLYPVGVPELQPALCSVEHSTTRGRRRSGPSRAQIMHPPLGTTGCGERRGLNTQPT